MDIVFFIIEKTFYTCLQDDAWHWKDRISMKKSIVGILAHVDAGKTTLAESLLCACGVIEKAGRVDHGDAFLDNGDMERKRGITIFSKQARIRWKDVDITLLDTPGHVDFSAEMERTLQVLDAAVLVIDGSDGVQGDVHTLWRLLKRYEVPVFLFVNKMDQPGTDPEKVLTELQKKLDSNITSVGKLLQPGDNEGERETESEHAAMCSEALMEEYLETGELSAENISDTVAERKLFPCFFGSALKQWGITELLDGLNAYLPQPEYPEEFGARVYKIGRDNAGIRLSYLKVTGGSLRVKMPVGNSRSGAGEEIWEEKCDRLRLYNGGSYEAVDTVKAGEVCAVTGLTKTFAGQGLGYESENSTPILEPVLTYRLLLPPEVDPVVALGKLRHRKRKNRSCMCCGRRKTGKSICRSWDRCRWKSSKISCGSVSVWKWNSMREALYTRKLWRSRWKASGILNPCVIMRRYICCWSPGSGAVDCNLPLCAARTCFGP